MRLLLILSAMSALNWRKSLLSLVVVTYSAGRVCTSGFTSTAVTKSALSAKGR